MKPELRAIANQVTWGIYDRQGTCVATIPKKIGAVRAAEIAQLLAASPDMLEALKRLSAFAEGNMNDYPSEYEEEIYSAARAAIAKATGQ